MRAWLHLLLVVSIACSGLSLPAVACAHHDGATEAATDDAAHDHCGGHDESAPRAPVPSTADIDLADGSGDCLDCCSGQCGCPCATLAALPTPPVRPAVIETPLGPCGASVTALVPTPKAPPLRPPIA